MVYNRCYAGVLELADEVDSKSIGSNTVRVQVPPPAPNLNRNFDTKLRFCFFARKDHNKGIFAKEKFRSKRYQLKIRSFSAIF